MTRSRSAVSDLVSRLNADLREAYEERAGIMEFDGGLTRTQAECLALLDLLRHYPLALSGVTLLKVESSTFRHFLLTPQPEQVQKCLSDIGIFAITSTDISTVIAEYGGLAVISPPDHLRYFRHLI